MPETDDYETKFTVTINHLRTIAEDMLNEHFGKRCPDFEPECECCKRWAALDVLKENPFV